MRTLALVSIAILVMLLGATVMAQEGDNLGSGDATETAEPTDGGTNIEKDPVGKKTPETEATDDDTATTQPAAPSSPFGDWKMIALIVGAFVVMYILMGRSRRKQAKKREEMLGNLKKGDKVTTIGGIIGTAIEVREDEVTMKVDETSGGKMKIARWAIRGVGDEAKKEKPEGRK